MKLVITGGNGQLGTQLRHILNRMESQIGAIPKEYENCEVEFVDIDTLDITDLKATVDFFKEESPDIVINSAAMTNVDGCEQNKDMAFKVNALGARNLAIGCEAIGAKLVQISTDYVFKGEGSIPYREYDIPNPVSIYGKTKYMGEEFVKEFCTKYFILRTAWLYGEYGNNFVKTILKIAKEKGALKVVDDQLGNPTYAEDLAHHILKVAVTEEYGTYHCTNEGQCSWYEFACKIVELAGVSCVITPCSTEEFPRPAERPHFSSLDKTMLRCTVGNEMRPWQSALEAFMDNYKKL